MKQASILIVYIFFLPLFSYGQSAILSTIQTRTLYLGFENKVDLAVPGHTCDELELQADNCRIKGEGCSYWITPELASLAVFIVRSKKSNSIIDTITIPVINAPVRVKIALGAENNGPLLKGGPVLVSNDHTFLENTFHFADSFHIVGFNVVIYNKNKDSIVHEHKTIGSRFDTSTVAAIENAQPGDKLILESIYVVGPDNRKRAFNSIIYTFK